MTANDNKVTGMGFECFFTPSPTLTAKLAPMTPEEVEKLLEDRYGPDFAQWIADNLRKGRA